MSVPPSDQMRATGSARRKTPLPPGRSQLHWLQLNAQRPPPSPRPISCAELAEHNSSRSAWLALHGTVYDVTQYVLFHPGGVPVLLAVAGKDATAQFNKYHPWVNFDFILSNCVLGPLSVDDNGSGPPTSASR